MNVGISIAPGMFVRFLWACPGRRTHPSRIKYPMSPSARTCHKGEEGLVVAVGELMIDFTRWVLVLTSTGALWVWSAMLEEVHL